MDGLFFGRIDYQDLALRRAERRAEWVWRASPSLGPDAQVGGWGLEKDNLWDGGRANTNLSPYPGARVEGGTEIRVRRWKRGLVAHSQHIAAPSPPPPPLSLTHWPLQST
eukprot:scaffold26117_cov62-Isochrysis_galbana.AAC.1